MQVFCVRFRGLYCLNDKPKTPSWPKYEQPYGMSWTMDEQCRQEFGEGFVQCKAVSHKLDIVQNSFCASKCKNACFLQFVGMDLCDMLWCSEGDEQYICKTKRSPPLPGTSCGYNKVHKPDNTPCIYSDISAPFMPGCIVVRVAVVHGSNLPGATLG